MKRDLKAVAEDCWQQEPGGARDEAEASCRWCHQTRAGGHAPECPCGALALALQQRDALADYLGAQKRYATMQGAVRLAKRPTKAEMKKRLDEAVLQLETTLARLRDLGIEEMVR